MRDPIRAGWWLWGATLATWFVATDYLGWPQIGSIVAAAVDLVVANGYLAIAAALGAGVRPYWRALQPSLMTTFLWSLAADNVQDMPSMLLASALATVTVAAFQAQPRRNT